MVSYLTSDFTRRSNQRSIHRRMRNPMLGVSLSGISRLARRGGVKRIEKQTFNFVRSIMKIFIRDVLQDALSLMAHANRTVINGEDIVYALGRRQYKIYSGIL